MRIEWSDQALDDLSAILHYVVDSFGETVAYKVNNEIIDEVGTLAQFPMMGRQLFSNKTKSITYRTLSLRHYKIVYYTKDNVLKIIMLWNNRRDNKTLIRQLSSF